MIGGIGQGGKEGMQEEYVILVSFLKIEQDFDSEPLARMQ
jgi:hypothetical protein